MNTEKKNNELIVIAVSFMLFDALVTVMGQTSWSLISEANYVPRHFLSQGPLFFWDYIAAYAVTIAGVMHVIRRFEPAAEAVCVFLVSIHIIGALTWFGIFLPGFHAAIPFYGFAAAWAWFAFSFVRHMVIPSVFRTRTA